MAQNIEKKKRPKRRKSRWNHAGSSSLEAAIVMSLVFMLLLMLVRYLSAGAYGVKTEAEATAVLAEHWEEGQEICLENRGFLIRVTETLLRRLGEEEP